jgi:hypothetical protein
MKIDFIGVLYAIKEHKKIYEVYLQGKKRYFIAWNLENAQTKYPGHIVRKVWI